MDCNAGTVPLESTFHGWDWCRAAHPDGSCTVLYNTRPRSGTGRHLALRFDDDGASTIPVPAPAALPPTPVWRVGRTTRADIDDAVILRTFEDTPFYARSLMQLNLGGEERQAMHESLDLDRFSRRWVQTLLPFRMPRRG
jgi:carotenoid 1,2-hydratase